MRMNSGAATIGNEFIDPAIFCGSTVIGNPASQRKASAARPIDTHSGRPPRMATSQAPAILEISPVMPNGAQRAGDFA